MSILSALGFVLFGAVAGMLILARWWARRMSDPEASREFLKKLHKEAHPHLLQVSLHDATPVCPCCGWSEPARPGDRVASSP